MPSSFIADFVWRQYLASTLGDPKTLSSMSKDTKIEVARGVI